MNKKIKSLEKLNNTLANLKLSIHHVGGRAGSRAFPPMKFFEKDIINVLYDADKDCLKQIIARNRHLESQLHVLPYAFGDKCKTSTLNINYDPYTSSLLETNESLDSFYKFSNNHDYILGETAKTVEKRDVEVVSIDHIYGSDSVTCPKPDFLSIDVEGGEYDILKGSIETMKSSVLAVYAEVTFLPFRKGQKNFGELCDFLSAQGYHFVTFANSDDKIFMQEMSPYRYPIGLRGGGFHTLSEALFLRKIEVVNNLFSHPEQRYINLRKLAFFSIVFNQIEYGLECLKQSRVIYKNTGSIPNIIGEPNYFKFLIELELAEKKHPNLFPKTFMSIYTYQQSKERFNIYDKRSKFESIVKKISGFFVLYKLALKIKNYVLKKLNSLYYLLASSYNSNFEKVFIKFKLIDQARLIKQKRILQQSYISKK